MTDYRLWPATSGPSGKTFDGGQANLAVEFYVTQTCWLKSFWIWNTSDYAAAGAILTRLWTVTGPSTGAAVAGTDAAFGTSLTDDAWNQVVLATPVLLTADQRYKAVCLFPGGGYAASTHYWDGGGAGASGITNGPLVAPGQSASTGPGQGTYDYNASRVYPVSTFNGGNYWVDVTVTDVDPAPTRDITAALARMRGAPVTAGAAGGRAVKATTTPTGRPVTVTPVRS